MEVFLDFLKNSGLDYSLLRLCAAAIMGGLIGSERGRHGRAAGLRTHILICIGAAMTSLTSLYLSKSLGYDGDVARLSAQVISGIGFLGAGTIMVRHSSTITGLTTAAGMWATAAIGVAVGYGFYTGAAIATIICIFSVTVLSRLERKRKNVTSVYIELRDVADTERVIDLLRGNDDNLLSYDIIPPKSGHQDHVGILCSLRRDNNFEDVKRAISAEIPVAMMVSDINS